MKIGIALWSLDLRGGTEKQALELAIQLQRMGHKVQMYCRFYDSTQCHTDLLNRLEPVKYLEEKRPHRGGIPQKLRFYADLMMRSRDLAALIDPDLDVLNCHDATSFLTGRTYKRYYNPRACVVGMVNDAPSYEAVFEPDGHRVKYVLSRLKGLLLGRHMRRLDAITVLDNLNMERLKRYFRQDSVVIRSGLNVDEFSYSPEKTRSEPVNLLSVGNFSPWRRYEDVVHALAILSKQRVAFRFHHFGATTTCQWYASDIKELVASLGLSNHVTFHGDAGRKLLMDLYAKADIFLFPNHPQTWGLAVFEALASGVPVIASSKCGAVEVLRDEETVLVVPPCSPEHISHGILKLIGNNDLWEKLRSNGRSFVESNIRWDLYAEGMVRVFENCMLDART